MAIRIGLIGAGRMGAVFAHQISYKIAEAEIIATADADAFTAKGIAERFSIAETLTDYHQLLKRDALGKHLPPRSAILSPV